MQPFERVVEEHGEVVMRVCRSLVGPTDADDAWSDSFMAALRAYPALAPGSHVRGWLVTIAYRTSIDHLRRRSRRATPHGDLPERAAATPDADSVVEAAQERTALREAISDLPDKQRRAVTYRYLADLPYEDVARLLDCSPAAARRNVADGLAALRRRYRKDSA